MKNVEFISAGAGSGKTFTLVKKVTELVETGAFHANEIILTTFTRLAASELKEKMRASLYKKGLFHEALNLESAAIGTIHSISYQILSQYWYLLGLSPNLRLIADESQKFYITQSLATLPTEVDIYFFNEVTRKFNIRKKRDNGIKSDTPDFQFWMKDLKDIIDCINNFGFTDSDIKNAEENSLQLLKEILNPKESGSLPSPEQILDIITVMVAGKDKVRKIGNIKLEDKFKTLEEQLSFLQHQISLGEFNISNYFTLVTTVLKAVDNKSFNEHFADDIAFLGNVKDLVMSHSSMYELLGKYIRTVFSLALKWKDSYETFKKERRLLDFNDIQKYFSELLEMPEVVDEIKSRYKVALVDEFQDCSPQQVKFFDKLSTLMEKNVWVGDIKQAIYNFRGTHTGIVNDVINQASQHNNGNILQALRYSFRSNSSIVSLVNSIFVPAFSETIEEELVKLEMPNGDVKYEKPTERDLLHWHLDIKGKMDLKWDALTKMIIEFISKENLKPNELALLFRGKSELMECAEAIRRANLPFNIRCDYDKQSEVSYAVELLNSIVKLSTYSDNNLSKAIITLLTEEGSDVSKILSSRLRTLADNNKNVNEWLDDIKLVKKIKEIKDTVANQSVSAAVETLLAQLNVVDILRRMDDSNDPYSLCRTYIEMAQNYESICDDLGLGCSMLGFVEYINDNGVDEKGNKEGITLSTYHGSKGLEWKCVILCSLEKEVLNRNKVFFGTKVDRAHKDSKLHLIPGFLQDFTTQTIIDRIDYSKTYKSLYKEEYEEEKRLLYVVMTRPKEYLITLTAKSSSLDKNGKTRSTSHPTKRLEFLTGETIDAISCTESYIGWFGHSLKNCRFSYEEEVVSENIPDYEVAVLPGSEKNIKFDPRDISPSKFPKSDSLIGVKIVGCFAERLKTGVNKGDDDLLGNCIHKLLCIYQDTPDFEKIARKIIASSGVAFDVNEFITSARSMYLWLEKTYGPSIDILRETPFTFINDSGQIVKGEIDLIYRTEQGDVLVDYKTFQGKAVDITNEKSKFYAGKYSGQIEIYRDAILRTGREIRDNLICYFNLGSMVRIDFKD